MIPFLGAVFLVIGFILIFKLFSIVEKSRIVLSEAKQALLIIRNPVLADDLKEVELQKKAKTLFSLFFGVSLGSAMAVLLPVLLLWTVSLTGVISFEETIEFTLSWEFLLVTTAVVVGFFGVMAKKG